MDDCLQTIRFQYNIRLKEGIGYSPFELLYGRKPNTSFLLTYSTSEEAMNERVERIYKKTNGSSYKNRNLQQQNVKMKKYSLRIGDVVLYRNILRKGKLEPKWFVRL